MENKTWCPLPWMSLNVRNNGDIRVCCQANTSKNQGLPTKEDGSYYNLGTSELKSYVNSDLMKEIRVSMLKGEYHSSCIRCEREDKAGMQSRKEWEKQIWAHHIDIEKAKEITQYDGTIDSNIPLRYADLRFGNLCNLKCRMCGPTDSNQWYEDQTKVWDIDHYYDSGIKLTLIPNSNGRLQPDIDIYSWYENENFWKELESEIFNLERIYIVGGEPLLIEQHYNFLNKCVEFDRAKDITVEYNSNITNIPKRAWEIWKHFKRVQIGVSLDGVGKINEYIRYPSKWSQIETNLRKLDNAEGQFKVWIAATVMVYNILHLPEFMLWKIKQNYKNINALETPKSSGMDRATITPHPLHKPDFLNIKIFPKASKDYIKEYFEKCKVEYKDDILNPKHYTNQRNNYENVPERTYIHFCKVLDTYVKYMFSEDLSHLLPKFWQYTDKLDSIREENLYELSSDLYNLLKGIVPK